MNTDRAREDLEALRGDLPQLRELVRDRAEAVMAADAGGASSEEVVELRRRHGTALGLLERQRGDIAALEAQLAGDSCEPVEDPVELALAFVRRQRRRFLVEADELEDALLGRLVGMRRLEGVARHVQ